MYKEQIMPCRRVALIKRVDLLSDIRQVRVQGTG